MNGTKISVLKETNKVSLRSFLEEKEGGGREGGGNNDTINTTSYHNVRVNSDEHHQQLQSTSQYTRNLKTMTLTPH